MVHRSLLLGKRRRSPLAAAAAFLTLTSLIAVAGAGQVSAVSQNEVITTVLYDGTPGYTGTDATTPTGSAPEPHTPGLDSGANNLVVRTHDQFAVRVDWNVNEDTATNVQLTVVLPAYAQWNPDATGMFAGCDPATSTFPDPQTLVCDLGDQPEGSKGAIRPVALLNETLDNTTFDVTATLTTDDDAVGVSDGLDQQLTVSEAPSVDYIKASPTLSPVVNNGTEDGYVVLFPFTFTDASQGPPTKGVGPINDAVDIELYDHLWSLTPSVRVATAAEMTLAGFGGAPCGDYAQTGPYVATSGGIWTCGAAANGAGGYPVVPVTISGFTSRPAPATLADGSANGGAPQIASGQLAVWLSETEVDAAIADPNNPDPAIPSTVSARFENSLAAQDGTTTITSADDVEDAVANGTSGPGDVGPPANNSTFLEFGDVPDPPPGGPTSKIWSDVEWEPGPLHLLATKRNDDDYRYSFNMHSTASGGAGRLPGAHPYWHGNSAGTSDFIGQVARGQQLTIHATVDTDPTAGTQFDAKTHGCVAFDNTHYDIVPIGDITVSDVGTGTAEGPVLSQWTVPSNAGPLAHFTAGPTVTIYSEQAYGRNDAIGDSPYPYTVEFSNAPVPRSGPSGGFGINNDELTCNTADEGTTGWVDSVTGDLSVFDGDGDGRYEGITRARYSINENDNWYDSGHETNGWRGMRIYFQAQVKDSLTVNTDNQELLVGHSYSYGDRDPVTGVPDMKPYSAAGPSHCLPPNSAYSSFSGNNYATTTGWCNNRYLDEGAGPLDDTDVVEFDTGAYLINSTWGRFAFADVVRIVGARLSLSKTNLDGANDIKDNGQLVQFRLRPTVTGATVEALTNVRLVDNLPDYYEFVRFVQLPTSPGSSCTESGGTINCQFSEPNPAVDTGDLPPGLAGGWSDEIVIEVMVSGAIADPDTPTVLTNVGNLYSSAVGPWDAGSGDFSQTPATASQSVSGSARSYMPLPADEGVILKAVDTLAGGCVLHPDEDPPPAGWADRCSMIGTSDDMSFILSLTNEGNTAFTDIELVDVFPHNADEAEPASGTGSQGGSASTLGDGRTPDSDYEGTLGFVSMTPVSGVPAGATVTTWVSGDDPATISRDPAVTVGAAANTWCDAPGGAVQSGTGSCPATAADVTATYTSITPASTDPEDGLVPGETMELRLTLDADDFECDDVWTNTFGLRTPEILLPVRSNDVSIMVDCEFDLALEKTVDAAWIPDAGWLTEGTSTIDFEIEVTNQGDRVEDFDVTDYVDTDVFSFVGADNPSGTTGGDVALPYTWDATDPSKPVVSVDGAIENGESVTVPVTLTVIDSAGPLSNWAEISYFDSDGDPSNGDSDPTNPNNPSTGALVDDDSVPDDDQVGDNQPTGPDAPGDGVITGAGDGDTDPGNGDPVTGDEDDHDVAGIPVYDLELVKVARDPAIDVSTDPWHATFDITVTNQGDAPVYLTDVIEYPPTGLTYDAAATTALWASETVTGVTDAAPTFTVAGPIPAGGAVTFPLVFDITDLTASPYVNAAEISGFDADNDPGNAADPFAVDVDSTPDTTNDWVDGDGDGVDDNGDVIDHLTAGYDPDADSDVNEPTPGDEDDHDIAELVLPLDLALQKRIDPNDPDLLDGVSQGDELTFLVEVYNQAGPVEDFHVTDYVSGSWDFDPASNPAGTTTGDRALPFTWDATDPTAPVAMVDGLLDSLESVVIPVVLTVDVSDVGDGLYNYAEISYFDNDGDPSNGDSDPTNPNNPPAGPLTDLDSTPDQDNTDPMVDDVLDSSSGDEDDHDQAFTRWWDLELIKERSAGQPYVIDPSGAPVTVSFELTVNNQGPETAYDVTVADTPPVGFTYDSLVDGSGTVSNTAVNEFTITQLDPGDSVTFTATYTVDLGLVSAPAINTAEISGLQGDWDPDGPFGPLAPGRHPVADIDSTPDADPGNDAITSDGTVDPADSHNTVDNDPDADGNLHNPNGIDEDDHDTEAVALPWDLALTKTFVAADQPLVPGGEVTMLITVTNQGPAVEQIDLVDHLDLALWQPFDPALNPGGVVDVSSTAAAAFGFTWDAGDPTAPVALIAPVTAGDKIGFGETVAVPITVVVADGFDTSQPLINVAEIARFDNDGDPSNGDSDPTNPNNPVTGPLTDIDSTPDLVDGSNAGEIIGDALIDDAVDGHGTAGGDEDDHDPVIIPVMDLALRKTVDPSTTFPVVSGGAVTFLIEVINQGNTHVGAPAVVDYVDPAMWEAFDPAANPAGATGGEASLPYTWTANANGRDGDLTVTGVLAPGQTVTVPVTLTIAASADLETLANTAEITGATATDETETEVTMPDGSPVTDIDSTADTTNDDPMVDDVVDGTDGDEDDHDIALVQPPTYSLGNQVWNDIDNDGMLEPGEDPITGVIVHLFADADRDGNPDDTNNDGIIDADDAVAVDTTGPDGDYLFTDLPAGDYIVGLAPANWDTGGALDNMVSSDPTSTDPNDDVDNNDDGTPCNCPDGYVYSGPVTLDDAEPTDETGLANDPDNPDQLSNLTVDFGFWRPAYDLALEKRLADDQPTTGLTVGDDVTFTIEVWNQGNVAATDIAVIDYIPTGMTLADPDWTALDASTATITLTGVTIPAGETALVDVTMRLTAAGDLANHAEITGSTPVDTEGRPFLEPNGFAIADLDSTPDQVNDDVLTDGVIDTDAAGGDEDDHDIATIAVSPGTLAFTGAGTGLLLVVSLLLTAIGLAALTQRRRREVVPVAD